MEEKERGGGKEKGRKVEGKFIASAKHYMYICNKYRCILTHFNEINFTMYEIRYHIK